MLRGSLYPGAGESQVFKMAFTPSPSLRRIRGAPEHSRSVRASTDAPRDRVSVRRSTDQPINGRIIGRRLGCG